MNKINNNMSAKNKKTVFAYLLLLPFLIGFLLFFFRPICLSIYYSFHKISLSGTQTVYAPQGWGNFRDALFADNEFRLLLISSFKDLAMNVPIIIFFSLFIAALLNKEFKGRTFVRAILFLPVIITTGALLQLETTDFMMSQGMNALAAGAAEEELTTESSYGIAELFRSLQLPEKITEYMHVILSDFYSVLTSSGVQITLLIAAWQSIPTSLYEASAIEGATAWEEFWKITLPMISPYIFVCTIYTVVDTFTKTDNKIVQYIDNVAKGTAFDYGLSSAMAWLYFIVIALCLGVIALLFIRGKLITYQER